MYALFSEDARLALKELLKNELTGPKTFPTIHLYPFEESLK